MIEKNRGGKKGKKKGLKTIFVFWVLDLISSVSLMVSDSCCCIAFSAHDLGTNKNNFKFLIHSYGC